MASKFKPFIEEIVSAQKNDGKSAMAICREIAKREDVKFDSLYKYIGSKKLTSLRNSTFDDSLVEHDFAPPANWSHGWLKTETGSIFVKQTLEAKQAASYESMRSDVVKEMKAYAPEYKKFKRANNKNGHALVIDIADLHIGKLATYSETNDTYNRDIAYERAISGVEGLIQKASGYEINKIFFVIGNDILHIDKTNRTTTAGTPQDTDGMWYEGFTLARQLYVSIIERLTEIADVHVVHCPSNHDFMSGFMLADSVSSWFNNNKNVTFDVSNNHRKYMKYGNSLLGFSHGDGAKMADMPLLMANEAKNDWATTAHRYVYLHHIHHKDIRIFQKGKDYQGVTVEYLRSPSGTDAWHHRKGYCENIKAVEGFIHSEDHGQVAKLSHIFK